MSTDSIREKASDGALSSDEAAEKALDLADLLNRQLDSAVSALTEISDLDGVHDSCPEVAAIIRRHVLAILRMDLDFMGQNNEADDEE